MSLSHEPLTMHAEVPPRERPFGHSGRACRASLQVIAVWESTKSVRVLLAAGLAVHSLRPDHVLWCNRTHHVPAT